VDVPGLDERRDRCHPSLLAPLWRYGDDARYLMLQRGDDRRPVGLVLDQLGYSLGVPLGELPERLQGHREIPAPPHLVDQVTIGAPAPPHLADHVVARIEVLEGHVPTLDERIEPVWQPIIKPPPRTLQSTAFLGRRTLLVKRLPDVGADGSLGRCKS